MTPVPDTVSDVIVSMAVFVWMSVSVLLCWQGVDAEFSGNPLVGPEWSNLVRLLTVVAACLLWPIIEVAHLCWWLTRVEGKK